MLQYAPIFHDHAVLQRDLPIPVWGTAGADEIVTVRLAGLTARTVATPEGHWSVRFTPLPAGGPHELVAESPFGCAVARDLLIGEVWLCSGQSNMQFKLAESGPIDAESAVANFLEIRMLTVTTPARLGRQENVDGKWTICAPETLMNFCAIGGWFGRILHHELGVPIGLICNAWGGSRIQAWISREALVQDPRGLDEIRCFEGYVFTPELQGPVESVNFEEWERNGAPQDAGNRGLTEGWAAPDFNDDTWPTMPVPSRWQEHGYPGSGVFWFRRTVTVPAGWGGRDLELHLGQIDKHDDTYVNAERIGGLSWEDGPLTWCTARIYTVPGSLVLENGILCIAVRVRSHIYNGGLSGPGGNMYLIPVGDSTASPVPLKGSWHYSIEQNWGVVLPPEAMWGPGNHNSPSILFDCRLSPVIPYALRGVLWYQGESNAFEARDYRRLMPLMIRDWRRAWGQGDFAFYQVQLANFGWPTCEPRRSDCAELREAQNAALSEPNTGIAVAIDVGEALDIHPKDKRTIGVRLAQLALAETYARRGISSGPFYASAACEANGRMRIRFNSATGLQTRDGSPVRHIAIAGLDRIFLMAECAIEGESLVVWHPNILRPAAVRYAWADNPEGCNLVNAAGLPASPFRTDSW